jgi:hypothetical protein
MEKFRILTGTHANWNSDVSFPLRQWKPPMKESKFFVISVTLAHGRK